jgi:hypothetical protein
MQGGYIPRESKVIVDAAAKQEATPVRLGRAARRACARRPGGHGPAKIIDGVAHCTACGETGSLRDELVAS